MENFHFVSPELEKSIKCFFDSNDPKIGSKNLGLFEARKSGVKPFVIGFSKLSSWLYKAMKYSSDDVDYYRFEKAFKAWVKANDDKFVFIPGKGIARVLN